MIAIALELLLAMQAPGAMVAAPAVEARACAVAEDDVVEVELLELTSIDWRPGEKIPRKIQELDGKKVVIKGVMAIGTLQGVDNFQLVNEGCNCGNMKVQHFVQVTLEDEVTDYTPDSIRVTGTFSVGELVEDGFVTSIYRLKDAKIESDELAP